MSVLSAPVRLTAALLDGGSRVLLGGIVLVRAAERLMLAGAAVLLGERGVPSATVATGVLFAMMATRTIARVAVLGRIRARLFAGVTRGLLQRDLLAVSSRDRAGQEASMFNALYTSESTVIDAVPGLCADAVAVVLITLAVAPRLPLRLVLSAGFGVLVAGVLAELLRRSARRASDRGWEAFRPLGESVHAAMVGAIDIVGNGRDASHLARVHQITRQWVKAARTADMVGGFAGRIPLALGLVAVVAAVAYGEWQVAGSPLKALGDALIAATLLPAFAGVIQGLVALTRATRPATVLLELLNASHVIERAYDPLPPLPAAVRWERVSFTYSEEPPDPQDQPDRDHRRGQVGPHVLDDPAVLDGHEGHEGHEDHEDHEGQNGRGGRAGRAGRASRGGRDDLEGQLAEPDERPVAQGGHGSVTSEKDARVDEPHPTRGDGQPSDALKDCTVDWPQGKLLAIAGPNGAGKSTLLRLLLGLARPRAGEIFVGGQPLSRLDPSALRRHMAYLPQKPYLPEHQTVREAMSMFLDDATDAHIERALERVGILAALRRKRPEDALTVSIADLSWGQRQRVALARVLARGAPFVLLDEPDASLDVDGIELVRTLLREMSRTSMVAVIAHTRALLDEADIVVDLRPPACLGAEVDTAESAESVGSSAIRGATSIDVARSA